MILSSKPPSPLIGMKGVWSVVGATLLAVELAIQTATPVAVVGAGISRGDMMKKVEAGLIAPAKLMRYLENLPKSITDIIELQRLLDAPWSITKVQGLMTIAKPLLSGIYDRERDRLADIMGGIENYSRMPTETLGAMAIVLIIYLSLAQSMRLIRLGDRDTWMDARRKDFARWCGSNRSVTSLSDADLMRELKKIEEEIARRR